MTDQTPPAEQKRPRGNPNWKRGVSANPGGRRKMTPEESDAINLAKQFSPDAVRALHSICMNPKADARARAMCANSILDRAWGKPKETIDATVKHEHRSESDILADLAALGLAIPSGTVAEGTAGDPCPPTTH